MTNDPASNSIIVNSINTDGTLAFVDSVCSGGRGMAGVDGNNTQGPDGLFSQDSVLVGGTNLFAVNAGSNSISHFAFDAASPTKLRLVGTVSSGGEFPMALAFSAKLGMVCAANGGAKNGIQCFTVEARGLTPVGAFQPLGIVQTTPPQGPLGTVSDILFNSDSSALLASVKGNPPANVTGFVASFPVSRQGLGAPVRNSPRGSVAPFSMTLVPGSSSVLFTDAGVGLGVVSLDRSGKETASAMLPIEGQGATCWSDFSPRTGTFFTSDIKTSKLTEVAVDAKQTKATLIKQYALSGNTIDFRVASLPQTDFLYVLTPGSLGAQVMSLAGGPGKASVIQTFKPPAQGLSTLIQGMAVFVSPQPPKCKVAKPV
ncbi:hypothetical protein HDU91_005348 [Kappamyces sp. JEL0680]|nr:hypothetical protein HDU91_005348 [Kappamyces sp. JEL0680]